MLIFHVKKQIMRLARDSDPVVADSQNYLQAQFTFSEDWSSLNKVAQFTRDEYHFDILLDDAGICIVPWEVLQTAGEFVVNVFGNNQPGEANKLVTTNAVAIPCNQSGLVQGQLPDEPTEGIAGQALNKMLALEADALESASRAETSQKAAAANDRTTATLAQDTVNLAGRIADMNSSILEAAEEVKEAARQAEESAGQAMSGTPEGYQNVADVVCGLVGYKFVIDPNDKGLNLVESEVQA